MQPRTKIFPAAAALLLVCSISLLTALLCIKPPSSKLDLPLAYSGDAAWMTAAVKGMKENGWFYTNRSLGAPGTQNIKDYPIFDSLHEALLKTISLFTDSPVRTMNLFYLLTFPLSALTALFAFRQMGLGYFSSSAAALLFTLLPYHFMRYGHLYLSAYFMVPLITAVIWKGFSADAAAPLRGSALTAACLIAFLTGLTGIYYAYFACFFFCVAGTWKYIRQRDIAALKPLALILACIVAAGALQALPGHLYKRSAGPNPEAVVRTPSGTEVHGLRIMQLLLPVDGHRIAKLAAIKRQYNEKAPAVYENITATLGTAGDIGFILLTLLFFMMAMAQKAPAPVTALEFSAVLTLAGTLFATMGGFGSLVAFLPIRGYNRISVFISYFSLFALFFCLEKAAALWTGERRAKCIIPLFSVLILGAGIYDQVSPAFRPDWNGLKAAWGNDRTFVESVESRLPADAMVFQLPYMPFPESKPVAAMMDYEHIKPYLHSKTLRWSYGAIKGRDTSLWQKETSAKPPAEMLKELKAKGFAAVYIDRTGFTDRAAALEAALSKNLKGKPVVSGDGRLSVFFI